MENMRIEEPEGQVIENKGKLNLRLKVVLLTYKTQLNKEGMKNIMKEHGVQDVFVSHETGESGYEHTHVACRWKDEKRVTSHSMFDIAGIHPNIKKVKVTMRIAEKAWKDTLRYITKEDQETKAEILEMHGEDYLDKEVKKTGASIIEDIQSFESKNEALKAYVQTDDSGRILNVEAVSKIFDFRDKKEGARKDDIIENEWNWQRQLRCEISVRPDTMNLEYYQKFHKRKVIWIYDPCGGCGKSSFVQNFRVQNPKMGIFLPNITNTGGIAHILCEAINNGTWTGEVVIVDLPRNQVDYNVCNSIEQIKNGAMNSTKYMGGDMSISSPHVVIFANQLPNAEQLKGFTKDRWDIRQIGPGMEMVRLAKTEGEKWRPIELKERMRPRILDTTSAPMMGYEKDESEEYKARVAALMTVESTDSQRVQWKEPVNEKDKEIADLRNEIAALKEKLAKAGLA